MAKVVFTAAVASITGKLSGSVFQRSHGGPQLRSKVSPANRHSLPQQALRANMGSLSTSWGALTPAQRLTWFNNAGMVPLGFPLYVKRNQALFLAGLPGIDSFVRGLPPLNLLQAANSPAGSPFFVGIDVNVPVCPGGFTQVNLWSKWVPPGRSFISRTRFMLTTDNFHWDTDASAYAFDPDAPDFPPASGWHMKVAYGAVQNSSGVLSLSNYLEFTNP